jgi:hypothetical protein
VVRKEKRRLTGETRQYMLFQSMDYPGCEEIVLHWRLSPCRGDEGKCKGEALEISHTEREPLHGGRAGNRKPRSAEELEREEERKQKRAQLHQEDEPCLERVRNGVYLKRPGSATGMRARNQCSRMRRTWIAVTHIGECPDS